MSEDAMKPSAREMKVLLGLCLGNIESDTHFGGVGPKTYSQMLSKGWIERAFDETYEVQGYRITSEGQELLDALQNGRHVARS